MERYAVYFAPRRDSALHGFGTSWLGWDSDIAQPVPQPVAADIDPAELRRFTQAPRRYGFHGTLKPPFRLREGTNFDDLQAAAAALAKDLYPVEIGRLRLKRLSRFLALIPERHSTALQDLAGRCVMELDRFRAPAPPEETERRRKAGLSARQEDLLTQWGYPYVLDQFRFHLTLTGSLDEPDLARVEAYLSNVISPVLEEPVTLADLCIFGDPGEGESCRIVARIPVGAV
ncbi:DUF1045 domain-containing protein [Hwanghaeella sp.]|uniref:DUF1045 domain-containing protein n=1 Tax=Hwanghaeella sp. TaxID=2605943 RepID=UPI003CCBC35D